MSGLSLTGFLKATISEIKEDLEDRYRAVFGSTIRTDPRSVFGQIIGILSASYSDLWEVMEDVYASFDPRQATGAALDAIAAYTGTVRKPASASTGFVTATGTATTVIPAGSLVTNSDASYVYETDSDSAALLAATAWAATNSVATGAYRTSSGGIYYALVGGVTGAVAPSSTEKYPITIDDGSVEWVYIGSGTAYTDDIPVTAIAVGSVPGPAYTLGTIGTPFSGWSGVANIEDVTQGREVETDSALRLRRVSELHGLSKCTVDSIRSYLTARTDVISAEVFQNPEDNTSADGLPPHSIEAVVYGPISDDDVAAILLSTVGAGIHTHGTSSATASDSHGDSHTIKFSRPDDVDIYLDVTVYAIKGLWPTDGADRIESALLTWGANNLTVGYDVEPSALIGACFAEAVPGLLSVSIKLGLAPSPSASDAITIVTREIAKLDSSRTNVSVLYRAI